MNKSTQEQLHILENVIRPFSGLSKDILIYGMGSLVGSGLSYLTTPVLARLLSIPEFGVTDVIATTVGLFSLLLSLNMNSGLWRYYYEIKDDDIENKKALISSTMWLIATITVLILGTTYLFSGPFAQSLFDSNAYTTVFRIALITIPLQLFSTFFIQLQRMQRNPIKYIILTIGQGVLIFGLTFVLLYFFNWGLVGVYWAQAIAFSIVLMAAYWMAHDLLGWKFNWGWIIKIGTYALPGFPAVLINWFLASSDRYFLTQYAGIEAVGYLAAANKVAGLLLFFTSSFRLAWDPFALSQVNKKGNQGIYSRGLDYYLYLAVIFGAGLAIFSRELILILASDRYMVVVPLVAVLIWRYIFQGMNNILGISIAISKRTIFFTLVLGGGALANLVGNLTLTALWGVKGAVLAELSGFIVAMFLYYWVSKKLYPIPWKLSRLVGLVLSFIGIWMLSTLIGQYIILAGWAYFVIRILLFGILLGIIYSLMNAEEKALVKFGRNALIRRLSPQK